VQPAKLIVADIDEKKREAALAAGAAEAFDPNDKDALANIMKATGGGVAGAIDFVGAPSTFEFGMSALRKNGTLVVVGLFGGAHKVSIPMFPFMAMSVRGSYVGNLRDMSDMMKVIQAGSVPPIPIETRPLHECNQALHELENGQVSGRIILKP